MFDLYQHIFIILYPYPQHIVGIRYATTPSDTPGEKDKVRRKFFMTSATRKRFLTSPLKRLHQHVQTRIHDKIQMRQIKTDEVISNVYTHRICLYEISKSEEDCIRKGSYQIS